MIRIPQPLPSSLSIAFWLVGSLWLVAIVAYIFNAPRAIVYAAFIFGALSGVAEWLAFGGPDR